MHLLAEAVHIAILPGTRRLTESRLRSGANAWGAHNYNISIRLVGLDSVHRLTVSGTQRLLRLRGSSTGGHACLPSSLHLRSSVMHGDFQTEPGNRRDAHTARPSKHARGFIYSLASPLRGLSSRCSAHTRAAEISLHPHGRPAERGYVILQPPGSCKRLETSNPGSASFHRLWHKQINLDKASHLRSTYTFMDQVSKLVPPSADGGTA